MESGTEKVRPSTIIIVFLNSFMNNYHNYSDAIFTSIAKPNLRESRTLLPAERRVRNPFLVVGLERYYRISPSASLYWAGYECEEGFELTPGNVPGRGFYNKNRVNSKMWEQKQQNVLDCFHHKYHPSIYSHMVTLCHDYQLMP